MAKPGRLIRIAANLLRPKMGHRHLFVYGLLGPLPLRPISGPD
jgi:hypothetical protein